MKKRLVSMLLGTLIVAALAGCGRKTPAGPVVSLPTSDVSKEQTLDSASESETESTTESKESKETSSESSVESKEESSEVAASSESEVPEEREPHESSEEGKEDNTSSKPTESKPSTGKESESKEQSKPSEATTPSTPESKPSESTTPSTPSTPTTPSTPESSTPSVPESSTPSEPAHTHNYVTTTISEATCQKAKVVADVCSCGAKINEHEEGEKKEHELGYKVRIWEPTCLKEGRDDWYCKYCNKPYGNEYLDPLPHNEALSVIRGNCVDLATLIYTCKDCGISRSVKSEDPQYRDDHVWIHGEAKEWNAEEEAWFYFEADWCNVCGSLKNRVDIGFRD